MQRTTHPGTAPHAADRALGFYRALGAAIPELGFFVAFVDAQLSKRGIGAKDRDTGLTTTEWVLLTALAASLAVVAGTIIYNKVQTKANSIQTTTP
jgi:hypothetical protein